MYAIDMENPDQVRSIVKRSRNLTVSKRLSFAPDVGASQEDDKMSHDSESLNRYPEEDKSKLEYNLEVTPTCKLLRNTAAGLCYKPPEKTYQPYKESLPIVPLKENTRNVFQTTFHSISSNTANVLILGNRVTGEKIKKALLILQDTQKNKWSLKWSLRLNIVVDEAPSPDVFQTTNYFIFLVYLNAFESFGILSDHVLQARKSGSHLSSSSIILCLSHAESFSWNTLTFEKFHSFLDKHRLCHMQWIKPDEEQYLKLLQNIQESVYFHSNVSHLSKTVFKWKDIHKEENADS